MEVLHRLLDVEPENPRVQMRLAELYNVMGQKKEAAQTYLNYAQRLFERGEAEEAEKLGRALARNGSCESRGCAAQGQIPGTARKAGRGHRHSAPATPKPEMAARLPTFSLILNCEPTSSNRPRIVRVV